jgi:hypothetical protein
MCLSFVQGLFTSSLVTVFSSEDREVKTNREQTDTAFPIYLCAYTYRSLVRLTARIGVH